MMRSSRRVIWSMLQVCRRRDARDINGRKSRRVLMFVRVIWGYLGSDFRRSRLRPERRAGERRAQPAESQGKQDTKEVRSYANEYKSNIRSISE